MRKPLKSLSKDERAVLRSCRRWGSTVYPIGKTKKRWFVDGMNFREGGMPLGACSDSFESERDAFAQWHRYLDHLVLREGGHFVQGFVFGAISRNGAHNDLFTVIAQEFSWLDYKTIMTMIRAAQYLDTPDFLVGNLIATQWRPDHGNDQDS